MPGRPPSGQRAYSESNLATVRGIRGCPYDEGRTIEGAKKRLLNPQAAPTARGGVSQSPSQATSQAVSQAAGQRGSEPDSVRSDPEPSLLAYSRPEAQGDPHGQNQANALKTTLTEVASELRAIRDLLG